MTYGNIADNDTLLADDFLPSHPGAAVAEHQHPLLLRRARRSRLPMARAWPGGKARPRRGTATARRRLRNACAERFAYEVRSRFGGEPILMEKVARNVLKHRRRFRALVLLADQSPGARDNVYWTEWLNQPTGFFLGPATISQLTGFPVMFARCRRKSRGRYHLSLIPIVETPGQMTEEEIIEAYIRAAEQTIREEPESYLWSNRRWKHRPPTQDA